ncbi:MAG: tRNA (cytidine(34)-2'-O)-methyltransferase [Desulfobacterales bacterium]|jgi:tRNA (cytidine/uridine-2'-O-)-methyltransferase
MPPDESSIAKPTAADRGPIERHVVLVAPEVHWNTGNIGRTCLGAGACLHLIRPLGFSLDDRYLKRAGLDYWPHVNLKVWDHVDAFLKKMSPGSEEVCLFSKGGARSFWNMPSLDRLFLVFGSETRGLPAELQARFPESIYHVPISGTIRSLNLSTTVGIVLYESLRQRPPDHGWPPNH